MGVPFKNGFKPNAPDLISPSNFLTIASLSSELKLKTCKKNAYGYFLFNQLQIDWTYFECLVLNKVDITYKEEIYNDKFYKHH